MELETINKLYLELSQIATATTGKELALSAENRELRNALKDANSKCRSAYQVAGRGGVDTNWRALSDRLSESLELQHEVMLKHSIPFDV